MKCKLGQVNVGRGKIEMKDIGRVSKRMGLDAVLIQEPYISKGQIVDCEGRWFYEKREGVEVGGTVIVLNKGMNVLMTGSETDGGV